jgi:hypothetical protein
LENTKIDEIRPRSLNDLRGDPWVDMMKSRDHSATKDFGSIPAGRRPAGAQAIKIRPKSGPEARFVKRILHRRVTKIQDSVALGGRTASTVPSRRYSEKKVPKRHIKDRHIKEFAPPAAGNRR